MLKIGNRIKNDRLHKALTGLSIQEFNLLLPVFSNLLFEFFAAKIRLRSVGGGRKGALFDQRSKLFFILFFLKIYPTYDLAAFIFGVDRSRAFHWVKFLLPILEKSLNRSVMMPKRKIHSIKELLELCPDARNLFIDGTERRAQKSKNYKKNKKKYSGKIKTYSRKNTIVSDEKRRIIFVSPTKDGRLHDLKQVNKSGLLEHIPKDIAIWVDKGYQGIEKYLRNDNEIMIPRKKKPKKEQSLEEKKENRIISGVRIVIEHAINGIKRFQAISGIYRNRKGQDDEMIKVCAGLWNLHLQHGT